jgi:adenylate cyclase
MGLWYDGRINGVVQIVLLFGAWTHVCIGLRFWLRLRPWYVRAQPWLYAVALLLPVLALMGFIAGEREIGGMLAREPGLLTKTLDSRTLPGEKPVLLNIAWGIRAVLLSAIAAVFIARMWR